MLNTNRMDSLRKSGLDHQSILRDVAALATSLNDDYSSALTAVMEYICNVTQSAFLAYHHFDVNNGLFFVDDTCKVPEGFDREGTVMGKICYDAFYIQKKRQAVFTDLFQTPYLKSDPDVQRQQLRSYLGRAIFTDGQLSGALSVYDTQVRTFDPTHIDAFRILTYYVSQLTAQHRQDETLRRCVTFKKAISQLLSKAISTQTFGFIDDWLETTGRCFQLDEAGILWNDNKPRYFIRHQNYWQDGRLMRRSSDRCFFLNESSFLQDSNLGDGLYYSRDAAAVQRLFNPALIMQRGMTWFILLPIHIHYKDRGHGFFFAGVSKNNHPWQDETNDALISMVDILAQWRKHQLTKDELGENLSLINYMFDKAPVPIYQIDLRTQRFIRVNEQVCQVTGYSEEELLAMNPIELLTPGSSKFFYERFADIITGDYDPDSVDFEIKTKSGPLQWGRFHLYHLYEDGQLWGANVVVHIITEQKKASEALALQRSQLAALVDERTRELSLANQKLKEEVVRRTETAKELRLKSERLKELNTAMRVLLDKRSEDRLRSEENIRVNLVQLIEPYLDRLVNSGLNNEQRQLLDVIKMNLVDVVGAPMPELSAKYYIFSPTELQVANLIRNGKTTKDIARMLGLSPRTVESYRNSIRKKLGLKNKKVNLKTYLSIKQ